MVVPNNPPDVVPKDEVDGVLPNKPGVVLGCVVLPNKDVPPVVAVVLPNMPPEVPKPVEEGAVVVPPKSPPPVVVPNPPVVVPKLGVGVVVVVPNPPKPVVGAVVCVVEPPNEKGLDCVVVVPKPVEGVGLAPKSGAVVVGAVLPNMLVVVEAPKGLGLVGLVVVVPNVGVAPNVGVGLVAKELLKENIVVSSVQLINNYL